MADSGVDPQGRERGELLVRATGLVKSFGGVAAVRHGDLDLYRGEVHALLGENGAGKSTIVNILEGVFPPDAGEIQVKGSRVAITSPHVSRALGISVVHQYPVLFPDLTVAENLMLGKRAPRTRTGLLNWAIVEEEARRTLARLDVKVGTKELVKNLSSADQQLLEIVKALTSEPDLLMLDEPTAALSRREVARLIEIIRRLKAEGVAILFVGHRLDEVFQLADRVTVARDGTTVITGPISMFTPESVVGHMVGHVVDSIFPKASVEPGPVCLEVRDLSRRGRYANVNFRLRRGEILGLAGLVGAGRTEIARAIFGLDPPDAGEILIDDEPVRITSPHDAMRHGIAYVPEDRQAEGVILEQSIQFNASLAVLDDLDRFGLIRTLKDREVARSTIERLGIRTTGPSQQVASLSGGNQQKVVLGKWLATAPRILILDDPTRGVDVGAKSELYHLVSGMVSEGMAILLISNELEELVAVADRIITFYRGAQGQEFGHRPFDAEKVLSAMTRHTEFVDA
ncbi:MAG: sugar ABC transporter ATP-binding protein [Actinomycetota bacterium]|nr:sugar ABC transporter ATP-binding protein [Actinomycetota bacterium]